MRMSKKMRAIHPGEILKQEIEALDYSANALAIKLHVSANRITAILNDQRGITADTALRLSKFFGTTPEFWMNLQTAYDLKIALTLHGKQFSEIAEYRDAA